MKWLALRLGGQRWTVNLVRGNYPRLEGAAGITYPDECRIYISRDLEPSAREDTLLHELLHATLYVSGGCNVLRASSKAGRADEAEEQIVVGLTPILHRLLRDLAFTFPKGPTE